MIQVEKTSEDRIRQGDILSAVEYIESAEEKEGIITVSKITFPLVIVLTQDCDLTWDYHSRYDGSAHNQDKYLLSAIVAPIYNYEHFINGTHLSELNQEMRAFNSKATSTENKALKNNETPRYHYLEFGPDIPVVNSVIDFKHYFTVNIEKLQQHKKTHFVCSVSELFRERISQRFANYLSRIGLPDAAFSDKN